ncbi:hypothetical protein D3C77_481610 [compost metagenome]
MYVLTHENPWNLDNQELFSIYKGATPDAECPVVVDKSTPSCGDSRFGCYVCTMVSQDKSMHAMIQNDDQKSWMQPILDFRNNYLSTNDWDVRDFRRMNGRVKLMGNGETSELIHGPYLQSYRAKLLEELLKTQRNIQTANIPSHGSLELISLEELDAIRRIWIEEKGEIEDLVPQVYERVYGKPYPGKTIEPQPLDLEDLELLKEVAGELDPDASDQLYQLTRNLLAVQFQSMQTQKRSQHLNSLEEVLRANTFRTEQEALIFARNNIDDTQDESIGEELDLIPATAIEARD